MLICACQATPSNCCLHSSRYGRLDARPLFVTDTLVGSSNDYWKNFSPSFTSTLSDKASKRACTVHNGSSPCSVTGKRFYTSCIATSNRVLHGRFPMDIVFRIYDNVLASGIEAMFTFSMTLLIKNEETLLSMKFDQLLSFLNIRVFEVYQVRHPIRDRVPR